VTVLETLHGVAGMLASCTD